MDFNPFHDSAKFVELLNSQQNVFFGSQGSVSLSSPQAPFVGSQEDPIIGDDLPAELPAERKERRMWTQTDDIVLISSWLNTSKDPIVGNEQKSMAFWNRIAAYFSASPKLAGCEKRDKNQCKQRWHKLNDLVCKFCGAYEAATREKTSDDEGTCHPPGVKATKTSGKKPLVQGKDLSHFRTMWSIKKEDLVMKEKISKMKLLESLVAKQVPLADYEEALKKKLINELM
ncbi:PREDICTED: uncharacterized protein LOC106308389 [Brassica oleracea var. oleracea]|nr:PREDICTED: uncharacterized protein LOC106308389 [Brassica oleracea var. oleracea]